jgi:vancomycin resistance protein YoaR
MPSTIGSAGAWRSLVARVLWEHEVGGSSPPAPTSGLGDNASQGAAWVAGVGPSVLAPRELREDRGQMTDTKIDIVPMRAQRRARRARRWSPWRLPRRWKPWKLGAVALGIGVLLAAGLVGFRAAREGTLPNLELDGTPVGSLGQDQLRVAVRQVAARRSARTIRVTRSGTAISDRASMTVAATDLGYRVDIEGTVRALQDRGRQGNPLAALADHVRATFVAISVRPVEAFDDERLDAWVESAADALSVAPREGALEFEGASVQAILPAPGAAVAEDDLRSRARAAARSPGTEVITTSTRPVAPRTTAEDVQRVQDQARQALSGRVRLTRLKEVLIFTPREIGNALGTRPVTVNGQVELELFADPERLGVTRKELKRIESDPVDASFRVEGGSVRVVPSKRGFRFDPRMTADQLVTVALSEDRRARLRGMFAAPELTTAEAKALKITDQVSTFTTYHGCCEPRVQNIHRMADLLDGTVVMPGEVFSVNETVGRRTAENGFVPAPAISNGEFVEEVGGGISQFATTMFNAIFFGGYDFLEYRAHSYYFSRYPLGREATVSWPSPDLKFRNDSTAGILIDTSYTDTSITVTFYGNTDVEVEAVMGEPHNYKDPPVECEENKALRRREVRVVQEGRVGYDVVVQRVFHRPGGGVDRENFFTRYRAEPRIEERRACD